MGLKSANVNKIKVQFSIKIRPIMGLKLTSDLNTLSRGRIKIRPIMGLKCNTVTSWKTGFLLKSDL